MSNVINIAASMLDAVLMILFLSLMFGVNKRRKICILLFILCEFLIVYFLGFNLYYLTIVCILCNFMFCRCCLQGSVWNHLFWSIIDYIPITISSLIPLVVVSIFTNQSLTQILLNDKIMLIFILIWSRLIGCCVYFFVLKNRAKDWYLSDTEWFVIFILITADIIVLGGLLMININVDISGHKQVKFLLIALLTMVILCCCIILCVHMSRLNVRIRENERLLTLQESQKDRINESYKLQEDSRILRHDMKHYVSVWMNKLEAGQVEQLKEDMQHFNERVTSTVQLTHYIKENDILNSVLYGKLTMCKEQGIECELEITTSYKAEVEMDIAIILSNLLDNAITAESAVAEKDRWIKLCIFQHLHNNHIIISNYIEDSVLESNPRLLTTHPDKDHHGLGLKSVRKIVDEHQGCMDISEEDNQFIVHIMGV